MECDEVRELLDAYALGAAEPDEAASLEEHVADCVRCWSSLNEAQRAAAGIALSTAMQRAPQSLRRRIIAETEREERAAGTKVRSLLGRLWPIGAGLVTAGAAASLAFAFVLNAQVDDLRDDNDQLSAEVDNAGQQLSEQRQIITVLAAPDFQRVSLAAIDPASGASGVYQWSDATGTGAILCNSLPALEEGHFYQVWLMTETDSYPAGSFQNWDGIGQLAMDLDELPKSPIAIGVSVDSPGAEEPEEMVLFAELQR